MKQLMLRHAFKFVNGVIFLVGPENLRSHKAMEKLGGVRLGLGPDADGRESFVYQINASTQSISDRLEAYATLKPSLRPAAATLHRAIRNWTR